MFYLVLFIFLMLACLPVAHYNGYKQGHKDGFELGKEKINEYALKINEAQGERIKELMNEKNEEIEKDSKVLCERKR